MKAFMVVKMSGGVPDFSNLTYSGRVLCAKTPDQAWGIYIVTGTPAQITAINALSQVYALCTVKDDDIFSWSEMTIVLSTTVRNQLNTWLAGYNDQLIPATWTYGQVCTYLYRWYQDLRVELNDVIVPAFRTAINTALTTHGYTNIPAGWTYNQFVTAIVVRYTSRWPQLDDVIDDATRTRFNSWLTAREYPTIPTGWTYRQTILASCKRLNKFYEIENTDVLE
jgi:hypothetical protein